MTVVVHLLGRPHIDRSGGPAYRFRSNKSWGALAYLLLSERPPTRAQLASMLFAEADDPARALRWSLAEIRRGLGDGGGVDGDPVRLRLPPGAVVDVRVVLGGHWPQALDVPGFGAELLEGKEFRGASGFGTWLLAAQRRIAAATESILHEAALSAMAAGRWDDAIDRAARVTAMNPLDENFQALLIRLYRLAGDPDAAARQLATCTELLDRELGVAPGRAVQDAAAVVRRPVPAAHPSAAHSSAAHPPIVSLAPAGEPDAVRAAALLEAGSAAIAAGAIDAGVQALRTAVDAVDLAGSERMRAQVRLELGEALVHSVRGLDEEGLGLLWEVDGIGRRLGWRHGIAQAMAERGYVDFLRARYDRAEVALTGALELAEGSSALTARAAIYLAGVASDRADYPRAFDLVDLGLKHARIAGDARREAYAHCLLGRVHLLTGEFDDAAAMLEESRAMAERERWLAFLPWPQALRADVQLARGDVTGAHAMVRQAFARACQLGDPCWEGFAARGLALVAEAAGDTDGAFVMLADARRRADRMPDGYAWLDGYILTAQCDLGLRHRRPEAAGWIADLQALAARAGMNGFLADGFRYGAALGRTGDAAAAALFHHDDGAVGVAD